MRLDQLIQVLQDAGVISRDDVEAVRSSTATGDPDTGTQSFLAELRRRSLLTDYQTQEIQAGQTDRLVIGTYVLMDRVGRGGMGQIFRARHQLMKREVAIKFMLPPTNYTGDAVARFRREVEAAAKLDHPRIVRALDAGERDGAWYLVMEYVSGLTLRDLVKKDGRLSVTQTLNIVCQIADALQYAHRKGVIHRDIKPSNVLFCRDNNEIKVLDMGLASLTRQPRDDDSDATASIITSSGQVLGTVDYMAPEQFQDATSAGPSADFYSLGCTLHYLLTGRPPYSGQDYVTRAMKHRLDPIPDLSTVRPEVTPSVQRLFEWLLEKDPTKRCRDASILIQEVNRIDIDESDTPEAPRSLTSTINLIPAPPHGRRRHRRAVTLAIFLLVSGLLPAGFWRYRSDDTASQQTRDTPAPVAPISWPADLLQVIDPEAHTANGASWASDDRGLLTGPDSATTLIIPHAVPDTYRLSMTVKRISGTGPLIVGLVLRDHHCFVLIDRKGVWGIGVENDRMVGVVENEFIEPDRTEQLSFIVNGKTIEIAMSGRTVIDWQGDYGRLTVGQGWRAPADPFLFLGTNNQARFLIEELTLAPLDPQPIPAAAHQAGP
ncbi:MAG: serine/threonine-protein kinase [Fuerstiella sp.]